MTKVRKTTLFGGIQEASVVSAPKLQKEQMVQSGKLLLLSVCTTAFFHKRSAEMKVKNASDHLEKESVEL